MTGEVIILTGPPGAGKTTVAKLLATSASVPTVHLTTDLFYRSIGTGFILPFLPEAQRQNEVVIEAITGLHATFAQLGELEDHAIDTGDLDAEQTAAEVRRVLASVRYRLM